MATIEIYLYSNCSSCRDADAMLSDAGIEATRRDLFKERMSAREIVDLFERANLKPQDMISRRSRPYRELGLAERELSDDEIVALMAEHPALIRRPVVVKDGRAVVGLNRAEIATLIA